MRKQHAPCYESEVEVADDKGKDKDRKDEENPEYDRFQDLLGRVLSAPKEEVDKRRDEYERDKERRRAG